MRKNKIQLIEVKPFTKLQSILSDEKKKQKFITAYHYCINMGWEFKIVTDNDLYLGNLLDNIKFLFMHSNVIIKASDKLKIKNYIVLHDNVSIGSTLSNLAVTQEDRRKYKSFIFNLIYNHKLSTDLSIPITEESIITIN